MDSFEMLNWSQAPDSIHVRNHLAQHFKSTEGEICFQYVQPVLIFLFEITEQLKNEESENCIYKLKF